MTTELNLLNLDIVQLKNWLISIGEQPFRAQQIFKWIYHNKITDFSLMTNLSKQLQGKLADLAAISLPEVVVDNITTDGTRKILLKLADGNCIETVYIPERNRATLCVSSQIGCSLNCSFCATGKQGFNRDLTTAEIIGQLYTVSNLLSSADNKISNIVFMGMGEPLLNYPAVNSAINIMLDDNAYGLSKYKVTLSTSGIAPKLEKFCEDNLSALAVSLHAPNNNLRDQLVPINKKYPLELLFSIFKKYFSSRDNNPKRHKITFEYIMLDGINDTVAHAKELVKLLSGIACKVNLIPFNTFELALYKRSREENISKFFNILHKSGIIVTVRRVRGDNIAAACGQLAGDFKDRTSRKRLAVLNYNKIQNKITANNINTNGDRLC